MKRWLNVIHPDDRDDALAIWTRAVAIGVLIGASPRTPAGWRVS